jgi:hypothetical protein
MATPFTGGCMCGAVRYECSAVPVMTASCHCRDCQRETGSAFVPVLAVHKTAFAITHGSPKYFGLMADSGQTTTRVFCAECGSSLFGLPGSAPDLVTIRAGSLDDPRR